MRFINQFLFFFSIPPPPHTQSSDFFFSKVSKRFSKSFVSSSTTAGLYHPYLHPLDPVFACVRRGLPGLTAEPGGEGAVGGALQTSGSCFTLTMIALVLTGAFWCWARAAKGDGEQFQSSPRCRAPGWGEAGGRPQQRGRGSLRPRRPRPVKTLQAPRPLHRKECAMARKSLKCGAI